MLLEHCQKKLNGISLIYYGKKMKNDDQLKLENQLCFLFYAATKNITNSYRELLNHLDLTYPQYLVMLVLWEEEPQTVGALGARLYLDSGTLTPLLKRMEAAGLVTRQRDPQDEHRVLIALTPKGRALREDAVQVPSIMTGGIEPEGVAELRDSVRALVAVLAGHGKPARP